MSTTNKKYGISVFLLLLISSFTLVLSPQDWRICERVVDGDTIVLDGNEKVRLIGVDTPETKDPRESVQYFGQEAYEFTKKLAQKKRVRLAFDQDSKDKYGRTLAYVYLEDGTFLNAEIIKQGYGFAYTKYPFKYLEDFRQFEKEAREKDAGLWAARQKSIPLSVKPTDIVFITPTGEKYHKSSCKYLGEGRKPAYLESALERGYKPCLFCNPGEIQIAKAEAAIHSTEASSQKEKSTLLTDSSIVYVTKTGKKFHRDDCRYLSKSKSGITLQLALDRGYTPCSVCISEEVRGSEPSKVKTEPAVSSEPVKISGTTVYITRTGKKYHSDECRYLSKSKIPVSLEDAIQRGYTPCSVCSPPTAVTSKPKVESTKPKDSSGDITVYITKTGSKYHRGSCSYLRKSKFPIKLKDAVARGYTPCSRCSPPRIN